MTDITIRDIPDDIAEKLMVQAKQSGLNREAWLRQRLAEIAEAGHVEVRYGQGLCALTLDGGRATIRNLETTIQAGATNLNQSQFLAYQRAKLLADPRNGSNWIAARKALEDTGLEVFWV